LKYEAESHSFQVYKIGGGYQFMTKPEYQASIGILLKHQSKRRLSTSALETIAIIAYKQPITKPEVEKIRGVNCDYSIQRLLDKGLAEIQGKSDRIGRPLLYGTSDKFVDYFGINSIDELPTTEDLEDDENRIGIEKE
jgi:segregation and condensation protein B